MMDKIKELHATVHELASETHRKTTFQKPLSHTQGSKNVYINQSKSAHPAPPPPPITILSYEKI
jgi:hypothetical protein